MKTNRRFKRFIYALLLSVPAVLLTGCQDSLVNPLDSENDGDLLEQAINWYHSQQEENEVLLSGSVLTRSGENMLFYTEPSWKYYYESENDRCRAIDVVLTDRIGLDFVLQDNSLLYEKTKQHRFRRSYSRLVILTSKTTGERIGFTMTLLPSVQYIVKYGDRIKDITYLKRDSHFDGMIFFHNLDGTFTGGWRYEDGKVMGWIPRLLSADEAAASEEEVFYYQMMPATYSIKGIGQTRSGGEGGGIIDGGELGEVIVPGTGGNSGGSIGGGIIIGGGGSGYNPDDNISGGGSTGGGSTSGGNNPAPEPKVDVDQSVKNDPRVNKILNKLMEEGDSYLNKLIARYQGGSYFNLTFKIDGSAFVGEFSKSNGLCYYDKNGATIYLRPGYLEGAKAIEVARTLLHEGLHAYINSIAFQENPNLAVNSLDQAWIKYEKSSPHHELMATREVDNIARELERMHKTVPEYAKGWDNDVAPQDRIWYYRKLVWKGLDKTEAYKNVSTEDKKKMDDIYNLVRDAWTKEW